MSAFVKDNTSKTTIYVGGLDDQVNEEILHAAFIPFGDIVEIQIPPDPASHNQHRGFGFVEFEEADDAQAAIDNMNLSELYGKVIKVNLARPMKIREGSTRAVWSEDAWLQRYALKSTDPNVPYGSDEEDTHSNDGDNGLGSQDQLKSGKSNI
nr:617_t:CDS:2 [Entrophospora candida]